MESELRVELRRVLNGVSAENGSNTPDFILAQYLVSCLNAFDHAVKARDSWYDALIVFTSNLGIYKLSDSGRPMANVTPDDALPEVQAVSRLVTARPGGQGAVRQVADWLLAAQV